MDKVSVIIVSLNSASIISGAVESVINQQYNDLELIVIDGGSTDGTPEILKKYEHKIAYFVSERDRGIYDAMNKGIAVATGQWLLFLGADDRLCEGAIEKIFSTPIPAGCGLVYGKIILDNTTKLQGKEVDFGKIIEANIPHQAAFYNKLLFQKYGGYDIRYKILADYDFNLKIFYDDSFSKKFIDLPVAVYCTKGLSSRNIDVLFFKEKKEHFIVGLGLSPHDKRLANYYFFFGVALMLKKNYYTGMKNILTPIIYSSRRLYYFIFAIKVFLSQAGFSKKFKCV